ncbi:hypothetical protein OFD71_33905, partial [Escherichia coli]|nr:hypothetical protein [Escherichia coli]
RNKLRSQASMGCERLKLLIHQKMNEVKNRRREVAELVRAPPRRAGVRASGARCACRRLFGQRAGGRAG